MSKAKKIQILTAERFVLNIEYSNLRRKIFTLFFGKDNSLYIDFPYYKHKRGLIKVATLPKFKMKQFKIPLSNDAFLIDHPPKFTYHPDGRAHFSKDSKLLTIVKKNTIPMRTVNGHLGTIISNDIDGFEIDKKSIGTIKRSILNFRLNSKPKSFRIILSKFQKDCVGRIGNIDHAKPFGKLTNNTNAVYFVITNNKYKDSSNTYCVILVCEIDSYNSQEKDFMFYGGFDHQTVVNDPSKETTMLFYLAPFEDKEKILKEINYSK